MSAIITVDAARVELLLNELRLPGIKLMWAKLAEQSDKEGWPAARFLAALAEHEMVDRGRRATSCSGGSQTSVMTASWSRHRQARPLRPAYPR